MENLIKNKYLKYALIFIFLTAIFFLLFKTFGLIKRGIIFEKNKTSFENFIKNNKKPPTNDINYIQNWMTFKYINFVFKLPENYLKDTLKIEDPKYPNLPIVKYTKNAKLDTAKVLDEIRIAVENFMKNNPPK